MQFKSLVSVLSFGLLFLGIPAFGQQSSSPQTAQSKPFTSQLHIKAGLTCNDCHGTGAKAPVAADKCLECHESFKVVAERTKDMSPNPHSNHLVKTNDVECTECHHGHKTNTIVCLTCHQDFTFNRKK